MHALMSIRDFHKHKKKHYIPKRLNFNVHEDVNTNIQMHGHGYAICLSLSYFNCSHAQVNTLSNIYCLKCSIVLSLVLLHVSMQLDKVEKFKYSKSSLDSLHAKYNTKTCATGGG